ncbi:unnamed protein product [Echinostoma caproni]|uniref:Ig-like domain-containing protein n=1 Tax=Echinostoma caproni TaxID=27848 RepID=A0A183AH41_9TREM|nr:unnamed protein product [Echinostoma caproni]
MRFPCITVLIAIDLGLYNSIIASSLAAEVHLVECPQSWEQLYVIYGMPFHQDLNELQFLPAPRQEHHIWVEQAAGELTLPCWSALRWLRIPQPQDRFVIPFKRHWYIGQGDVKDLMTISFKRVLNDTGQRPIGSKIVLKFAPPTPVKVFSSVCIDRPQPHHWKVSVPLQLTVIITVQRNTVKRTSLVAIKLIMHAGPVSSVNYKVDQFTGSLLLNTTVIEQNKHFIFTCVLSSTRPTLSGLVESHEIIIHYSKLDSRDRGEIFSGCSQKDIPVYSRYDKDSDEEIIQEVDEIDGRLVAYFAIQGWCSSLENVEVFGPFVLKVHFTVPLNLSTYHSRTHTTLMILWNPSVQIVLDHLG